MHSAALFCSFSRPEKTGTYTFVPSYRISPSPLNEDETSSFISSLHLRPAIPLRVSWTAIESHLPLKPRARSLSRSCSPLRFPSVPFPLHPYSPSPLLLLLPPRVSPVHRCHPSQSSSATSLGCSSASRRFFFVLTLGFRSVGLWGRKNQRTRTDASTEMLPSPPPLLPPSIYLSVVLSLSVGRL